MTTKYIEKENIEKCLGHKASEREWPRLYGSFSVGFGPSLSDDRYCRKESEYYCSRKTGHKGKHVALGSTGTILEVW